MTAWRKLRPSEQPERRTSQPAAAQRPQPPPTEVPPASWTAWYWDGWSWRKQSQVVSTKSDMSKRCTAEFERDAVALALSSEKTVTEVARDLGVSPEGLHGWVKQVKTDRGEGCVRGAGRGGGCCFLAKLPVSASVRIPSLTRRFSLARVPSTFFGSSSGRGLRRRPWPVVARSCG
ncbi:transposase [Streptomyces sp. NPDC005790]|uniref:transposase n=1 Tax=Streptomyces sp. NPDC005790 TaxID=3154777 RepID=UPI0033F8B2C5